MNPFDFYNPTRILFGEGRINELSAFVPEHARVLFAFDQEAVMANGVYHQVKAALAGFTVIEFGGITPNPDYDFLIKALPLIAAHQLDFIVAAGGGSAIDGAKFIAAAAQYAGDPWALTEVPFLVEKALPLAVIQTHPAAGTEMNQWGVVNRRSLKLSRDFSGEVLFPKVTILDPQVTLTLAQEEITHGVVDAFAHVLEQYVTIEAATPLQDRQAEAQILTIIDSARAMLEHPKDLDARGIFMWCAASVLNDHLQTGNFVDFTAHRLCHVLTALYDIKHGEALALILVPTFRVLREMKREKLCRYGRMVWGLTQQSPDDLIAATLQATEQFLLEVGAKTDPAAFGLSKGIIPEVLAYLRAENMYPLGECHPVYEAEVMAILNQLFKQSQFA